MWSFYIRSYPTGWLLNSLLPHSWHSVRNMHMNETQHCVLKQTSVCEKRWSFATSNFKSCFCWHLIWEPEQSSIIVRTHTHVYTKSPTLTPHPLVSALKTRLHLIQNNLCRTRANRKQNKIEAPNAAVKLQRCLISCKGEEQYRGGAVDMHKHAIHRTLWININIYIN